jgi:hypothetical protein
MIGELAVANNRALRLTVEDDVDRKAVAFVVVKGGAGEAEQPRIAGVLADDEAHAAGVGRSRRTMREGAGAVVGERAAHAPTRIDPYGSAAQAIDTNAA